MLGDGLVIAWMDKLSVYIPQDSVFPVECLDDLRHRCLNRLISFRGC
jgi:hypothetical protein